MDDKARTRFILEGRAWRTGRISSRYGADVEMCVEAPYPHMVSIRVERGARMSESEFDERLDEVLAAPSAAWNVRVSPDRNLVCLVQDVTAAPPQDGLEDGIDPETVRLTTAFCDEVMTLVTSRGDGSLRMAGLMIVGSVVGLLDAEVHTETRLSESGIVVTLRRDAQELHLAADRNGTLVNALSSEKMDVGVARDAVKAFVAR
jgi:hypothetical protein